MSRDNCEDHWQLYVKIPIDENREKAGCWPPYSSMKKPEIHYHDRSIHGWLFTGSAVSPIISAGLSNTCGQWRVKWGS